MEPRTKRRFSHLYPDDRRRIERWRNHYHDVDTPKLRGSWGVLAQRFCDARRHKDRKLLAHPKLLLAVTEKRKIGWN